MSEPNTNLPLASSSLLTKSISASRLIDDAPSRIDEIGSHLPLARTLANLISTEPVGRAIALVGEYGSGKSTVVQLLSDILEDNKRDADAHVFVFDAWAHQGDSLRRSFLLKFLKFLEDQGLVPTGSFRQDVEELNRRVDVSVTTPEAMVTAPGLMIVLSLPLAALAAAWVHSVWWASFGVLLPGLIGAAYVVRSISRGEDLTPEKIYEIFRTKPRETTHIATVKTPDPTSVEFRDYFDRAISLVKQCSESARITVVLDNLDRLRPSEAFSLFATMRTFFDRSSAQSPWESELTKRLWLLVPFNRSWLKEIAGRSDAPVQGGGDGSAFLQKSFQVTLEVSPPMFTSWRTYLYRMLESALPECKSEFETIFQLYRRWLQDGGGGWPSSGANAVAPMGASPRALKQFVNQLVVSRDLHGIEISLSIQAAYLLLAEPSDLIAKMQGGHKVENRLIDLLVDPDAFVKIAALYYNVSIKYAKEILFTPSIVRAIEEGKPANVSEVSSERGFTAVFDSIVVERLAEWRTKTPHLILNSAHVLEAENLLKKAHSTRKLADAVRAVSRWNGLASSQVKSLITLLSALPESERKQAVARALGALAPASSPSEKSPEPWLKSVSILTDWASEFMSDSEIREALEPSSDPNLYLETLSLAGSISDRLLVRLPRPLNDAELTDALERFLSNCDDRAVACQLLAAINKVVPESDFGDIITFLRDALASVEAIPAQRAASWIESLCYLAFRTETDAAADALKTLSTNGQLLRRLDLFGESQGFGRSALPYLLYGDDSAPGNAPQSLGLLRQLYAKPDDDRWKHILVGLVDAACEFGLVTQLIERFANNSPTQSLARIVFDLAESSNRLSPKQFDAIFVEQYDVLVDDRDLESQARIWRVAISSPTIDTTLVGVGYDGDRVPLYLKRLEQDIEPSHDLIQMIVNGTVVLDDASWYAEIQSNGALLRLVGSMLRRGVSAWLGPALANAIEQHLEALFEKSARSEVLDNIRNLLPALKNDARQVLLRNVYERMERADSFEQTFDSFGQAMIEERIFAGSKEAADRFARLVLTVIIESDEPNVSELKWAIRFLNSEEFASALRQETKNNLFDSVQEISQKVTDPKDRAMVMSAAAMLGGRTQRANSKDEDP